jgi:hypothetical protein
MITKEKARNLAVKATQSQIDEIYNSIEVTAKLGESHLYVYNVKSIIKNYFEDNGFETEAVCDPSTDVIFSLKIKW